MRALTAVASKPKIVVSLSVVAIASAAVGMLLKRSRGTDENSRTVVEPRSQDFVGENEHLK